MDKLVRMQIALFFSENESRPDRLMSYINDKLGNLFDAMPSILPIPQEAPVEIPVVILSDLSQKFSCNIARSRVDFIRTVQSYEVSDDINLIIDFQKKSNLFIDAIVTTKTINRFGFVGQYFIDNKNPTHQISKKFIKPDLGALEELTVRYNKKKEQFGIAFNDIYEIASAREIQNTETKDGVFIQRDFNNSQLQESLSQELIRSIIDKNIGSFQLNTVRELFE